MNMHSDKPKSFMGQLKSLIRDWQIRSEIAATKETIRKWQARADMARVQGSDDLVQKALEHKLRFEDKLQDLKKTGA
jgi:phage shock protein A